MPSMTVTHFNMRGSAIVIASVALAAMLASIALQVANASAAACVHPGNTECPVLAHIPLEFYPSILLLAILGWFGWKSTLVQRHAGNEFIGRARDAAKRLEGDEKTLFDCILASDGAIFQSELVQRSGFLKVKVSRIIDKLEAKGLVERRRRGMSNMIVIRGA